MGSKRYISIDTSLLSEDCELDFDVYSTDESKTHMSLFLQSHSVIQDEDRKRLAEVEKLYVDDADYDSYTNFADNYLKNIAANPNVAVEKKAKVLYSKAISVINNLFDDPKLANVKECEKLVEGFITLVKDDNATVSSLMKIAAHDYYTHTHSINVSIYSLAFGHYLGLDDEMMHKLSMSSILHDLGKSKVSYQIINKNGKLTDEEFEIMKNHPADGYDIALSMGINDQDVLQGIRHHHEKMDGTGYPDGLKDTQISLFARIIGICDIFDALTTKRSYKPPLSTFEAISLMKERIGKHHIDLELLKKFIMMLH